MIIAAKTASTVVVHLVVASAVGYVLTGSWTVAGLVAVVEPLCNVVVLHFHEKAWERIKVGKGQSRHACVPVLQRA